MNNKVTPENYEGYCELFKSKIANNAQIDKYVTKVSKTGIIPGILVVGSVVFHAADILVLLSIINFILVPPLAASISMLNDKRKLKKEFSSKYPDIDVNLTIYEIENMLIDAKILKCGVVNGQYRKELDVEGYKNYIKCEKIKQEVIDNYKKLPLEADYDVPSHELDKAKVKVKTMIKNRDL